MQENRISDSQAKLPTMKFFNFNLDVVNLKKALDFYAWFTIFGLALFIPMGFLLGSHSFQAGTFENLITTAVFGFNGSCCYFFRYSPYMHGILVVSFGYSFVKKINILTKFRSDSYLIERLKTVIFNEENFSSIHDFFVDSIFTNVFNDTGSFAIGAIFLYFAYSYQKLIKLQGKSINR